MRVSPRRKPGSPALVVQPSIPTSTRYEFTHALHRTREEWIACIRSFGGFPMQFEKSSLGWIAGAAALVGGAVYLVSRNDIRFRMTPDNSVAFDREIARVSSDQAAAGAGITAAVVLAGLGLWQWQKRRGVSTKKVEETIELNVPVSTAYNQWTQFEDFPRFMPTVQRVTQLDDRHLRWRAIVG